VRSSPPSASFVATPRIHALRYAAKEAWALLDSLDKQASPTRVESIVLVKALYA
jgi:hypothetical protein